MPSGWPSSTHGSPCTGRSLTGGKQWTRNWEPAVMKTEVEPLRLDFVADDTCSGLCEHPQRTKQQANT